MPPFDTPEERRLLIENAELRSKLKAIRDVMYLHCAKCRTVRQTCTAPDCRLRPFREVVERETGKFQI
jgi:hypothetical protein